MLYDTYENLMRRNPHCLVVDRRFWSVSVQRFQMRPHDGLLPRAGSLLSLKLTEPSKDCNGLTICSRTKFIG